MAGAGTRRSGSSTASSGQPAAASSSALDTFQRLSSSMVCSASATGTVCALGAPGGLDGLEGGIVSESIIGTANFMTHAKRARYSLRAANAGAVRATAAYFGPSVFQGA